MFATQTKHRGGSMRPSQRPDRDQLREDRITFILVALFVALLVALVAWIASVSPPVEPGAYNYWMY